MKEFKLEEVLEKLTTEELVSELVRRNEEKELVQISFQYLLKKVGYTQNEITNIHKEMGLNREWYPKKTEASN